ncbi:MAG: TlpA family protein disulfide reductase [bacterium]|nr:TlpA family protein disulfide reductase [bacterium]
MQGVYEKYKDRGLVVVSVSLDRISLDEVKKFVEEMELTFPNLHDAKMSVGAAYQVRGIPATHILDRTGKAVGFVVGPRDWAGEEIAPLLEQLLAEGKE